jgi:hypothetical protein
MAAGDLVTLAQVQTAYPVLTAAQLADLPQLISCASAEVSRRYPKLALRAAYDETHDPGVSRAVALKRRPVLEIVRVRADLARVLTLAYSGAGRRASVEVVNAGEADAPAASSLALNVELNGAPQTPVVLDFAAYPTVQALADHAGTLAGWSASVAPGQGDLASADLEPTQGRASATGAGAGVWGYTRDLGDFYLRDPLAGELLLYEWRSASFLHPGRAWGSDPRSTAVRVQYYAGRLAAPADVVRAVLMIVRAELLETARAGLAAEERSDDYAYRLAQPTYQFPPDARRILSAYRNRGFF